MKGSMKTYRHRKSRKSQKGGTTFTTQEKDNLIRDGGFTQEHLDYLASLPENFRREFGGVTSSDYDFIKDWQKSISELYDIPFIPENMKEIADRTIQDFKYHYERRNTSNNIDDSITFDVENPNEINISNVSLGGKRKKTIKKRGGKKSRKSKRKN
jgi:hypothetical protein